MRNIFSFTLAGALGLSAAVGATSFATLDFEDVSFPQVLSDLGFQVAFNNAIVEPQSPDLPVQNSVVRLRATSTISPFGSAFQDISQEFPAFETAVTISRIDGATFGFASALVDAAGLGTGQALAFATRDDGSFVGQPLRDFDTGGRIFSSFNPSAPSFASGLTSLSFAANGAGATVAFDNIVLCDPLCDIPDAFDTAETLLADDDAVDLAAVPLPSSALFLMAGLGGLGMMRRRRKA